MNWQPAQYLLRFDDLCPTMDGRRWQRFQWLIEVFGVQPILAVVPENCDPDLEVAPADPHFWARMREMEALGATIALHGYRHLCVSDGRSMLPLHKRTEFAGIPASTQHSWIQCGLEILRGHRLHPKVWVAPRHGFDCRTLRALRAEGIKWVSDGVGCQPFQQGGLNWIPQQLWQPVEKSHGLWTICLHSNSAGEAEADRLHEFLCTHAAQCTSLERIAVSMKLRQRNPIEKLVAAWELQRMLVMRSARRWRGRQLRGTEKLP
jgi:hypothetical protein